MRKDIFVVGARLLGVMQLVDAVFGIVNLISQWAGIINPPSYGHGYSLVTFGVHLILGLYLTTRPYHLFSFLNLLTADEVDDLASRPWTAPLA